MRDPALFALLGLAATGSGGADFGADYDDEPYNASFGADYFGNDFGNDFGLDYFGADAPAAALPAAAGAQLAPAARAALMRQDPQVAAMWAQAQQAHAATSSRDRLLNPNRNSKVKVERYVFALNQNIVLGTEIAVSANNNPDTTIRPQRVTINAPAPGFVTVDEIKVANVSVTVGGTTDAYEYSPLGVGQSLDMPTLTPSNRASILGDYTGFVPTGFTIGATFKLCVSFKGPATVEG
jgi:hypothetical protein